MQWPARRSQGCEVARVLTLLDTDRSAGFPLVCRQVNFCKTASLTPYFSIESSFQYPFAVSPHLLSRTWTRSVDPEISQRPTSGGVPMERHNPETIGVRRTGWAALDRDPQLDKVEFVCPHCGQRDQKNA